MRQTKIESGTMRFSEPVSGEPGLGEGQWYYASLSYGDKQMGILLETDDEDEAWHEAEEFCDNFSIYAKVITIQKVVLQ